MYQGKFSNHHDGDQSSSQPEKRTHINAGTPPQAQAGAAGQPAGEKKISRDTRESNSRGRKPGGDPMDFFPQMPGNLRDVQSMEEEQLQFNPDFPPDDLPLSQDYFQEPYAEEIPQPVVRRKHHWVSGLVFYLLIAVLSVCFYFHVENRTKNLHEQLIEYEKIQPTYISASVFQETFGNRDWAALFNQAHASISQFEGKEAYASYMQQKVGDGELTYRKTADLSETELQYGVYLKKEKIASFTMVNHGTTVEKPDWRLGTVEIFFTPDQNYFFRYMDNQVLKINGIPAGDEFAIRKDCYAATEYVGELADLIQIPGVTLSEITEFLVKPTVTLEDENGKPLEVSYDETTKTFSGPVTETEVPQEARDLGLNAVKTYCEFMIKKANTSKLSKVFKPNTPTYKAITGSDLTWIQKEKGHSFANEKISDYIRYDEDTFSVRVSLTWQLVRQDDSVKESNVDVNLVFRKEAEGKWRCIRMTGYDFTKPVSSVRVRFFQDGELIASRMVESDRKTINCPDVKAPEGKVLAGWFVLQNDEEGKPYYQRVLNPDSLGKANVFSGLFDEPIDLNAVFEEEGPILKRETEETVTEETDKK